jgi:hypothetical protein
MIAAWITDDGAATAILGAATDVPPRTFADV